MAGNGYDNGQGAADPRQGWPAAPGGPSGARAHAGQYGRGQQDEPLYASGQPEFFTGPHDGYRGEAGPGGPTAHAGAPGSDEPGHTRAFAVGEQPYPYGEPPYQQPYEQQPYGQQEPYGQDYRDQGRQQGYGPGYDEQGYPAQDNVAVYRAGGQAAPHAGGPRLPWKQLLAGMYREPSKTFDRMRDHQVWLPALSVSLIYGVLAVLGMGATHNDVVNSTFSVAAWAIVAAAIGFTLAGGMLGAVTYALARQFGGDGPWQSTVGLAVLIGWTTDAPRLLFALFLPASNPVVQVLGWATWLFCAFLLTTMVRRLHDLPWGKAAGAAAVQLLALLVLIKLPTLG
ncbi:Yip1 family protein [Saccharothrix sp. ST-888]|uniref:Yip1 family protein n=1 Tax=Saccharothrix sp. ST-888 TaxID=1427391 RepID=UPI0006960F1A|nr:Yip1 family protein [Saccharothrix sp. ST-888]